MNAPPPHIITIVPSAHTRLYELNMPAELRRLGVVDARSFQQSMERMNSIVAASSAYMNAIERNSYLGLAAAVAAIAAGYTYSGFGVGILAFWYWGSRDQDECDDCRSKLDRAVAEENHRYNEIAPSVHWYFRTILLGDAAKKAQKKRTVRKDEQWNIVVEVDSVLAAAHAAAARAAAPAAFSPPPSYDAHAAAASSSADSSIAPGETSSSSSDSAEGHPHAPLQHLRPPSAPLGESGDWTMVAQQENAKVKP